MISPGEITKKAKNRYTTYQRKWLAGESDGFFPHRLGANLEVPRDNVAQAQAEVDRLRNHSKSSRGWGYRVEWKRKQSRDLGLNDFPSALWIDTREDLLFLCDAAEDFARFERVVTALRMRLPGLESWMQRKTGQLAALAHKIDDLIAVAEYFVAHPWPDCFIRELPLPVDTKFVQRNTGILQQWLDLLLDRSQMDVNESEFVRRFGLRDDVQHHTIHLLDDSLRAELGLPFEELSLTRTDLANLPVRGCKILIVENRTNLLTLPSLVRGIGLGGVGSAVTRFRHFAWLAETEIYYWGDLDTPGLRILSDLRRHLGLPVHSLMMDLEAMDSLATLVDDHPQDRKPTPPDLEPGEQAAYERCRDHQVWLEQERIPQSFVREYLFARGRVVRT